MVPMRRLPTVMLLAGWAWVVAGCSAPVASVPDEPEAARKPAPGRKAKPVIRAGAESPGKPKPEEEAPFRLPEDEGGALLAKVLPPGARGFRPVRAPERRPRRLP